MSLPSHKLKVTIRGTFQPGTSTAGASGTGYVIFNPWLAVVNDGGLTGLSDNFPIVSTDSTYTGPAGTYTRTVAGGVYTTTGLHGQNSNSPFATATFTNNLWDYRLVAAGLRARYIGDDLHNSGRFILFRDQANGAVQSSTTTATMLNDVYSNSLPVKNKQNVFITYQPAFYNANNYAAIGSYTGATPNSGRAMMIIVVDGCDPTNPQSFEYEAVAFYEIVGRNLDTTPSESDPNGFAAVNSSVSQMIRAPLKPPEVVEQTLLGTATQYLGSLANNIGPSVINAGGKLLGAAARSYFGMPPLPALPMAGPTVTEL